MEIHSKLETLDTLGLSQIVVTPTWEMNILDLHVVVTNYPPSVNVVEESMPDISN